MMNELAASPTRGLVPQFNQVIAFVHRLGEGDGKLADDNDACVKHTEMFGTLERTARSTRTLFRSAKKCLAHGAQSLQGNDTLAFMGGATVPFVIRRLETGNYRLIG